VEQNKMNSPCQTAPSNSINRKGNNLVLNRWSFHLMIIFIMLL
jgi:hypothetical protein